MIELACHAVAHGLSSLAGEAITSVLENFGGAALGETDRLAEVARLARQGEIEQTTFASYMASRDMAYDETAKEWGLSDSAFTYEPFALTLTMKVSE